MLTFQQVLNKVVAANSLYLDIPKELQKELKHEKSTNNAADI